LLARTGVRSTGNAPIRALYDLRYAEKVIPPVGIARQQCGNVLTNLRIWYVPDFRVKSAMKSLDRIVPTLPFRNPRRIEIPHSKILLTTRIMNMIFGQLNVQLGHPDASFLVMER